MIRVDTKEQQALLIDAIDIKLASIKRAVNSTKGKWRQMHEEEYDLYQAFRLEAMKAIIGPDELKKPNTK